MLAPTQSWGLTLGWGGWAASKDGSGLWALVDENHIAHPLRLKQGLIVSSKGSSFQANVTAKVWKKCSDYQLVVGSGPSQILVGRFHIYEGWWTWLCRSATHSGDHIVNVGDLVGLTRVALQLHNIPQLTYPVWSKSSKESCRGFCPLWQAYRCSAGMTWMPTQISDLHRNDHSIVTC